MNLGLAQLLAEMAFAGASPSEIFLAGIGSKWAPNDTLRPGQHGKGLKVVALKSSLQLFLSQAEISGFVGKKLRQHRHRGRLTRYVTRMK